MKGKTNGVSCKQEIPEKYMTISMHRDPVFMDIFYRVNEISVLREHIEEYYKDNKITLEMRNKYLQWITNIEHDLELDL